MFVSSDLTESKRRAGENIRKFPAIRASLSTAWTAAESAWEASARVVYRPPVSRCLRELAVVVALVAAALGPACGGRVYAGWEFAWVAPDYQRPRALTVVVVRPPADERPVDEPMKAL